MGNRAIVQGAFIKITRQVKREAARCAFAAGTVTISSPGANHDGFDPKINK